MSIILALLIGIISYTLLQQINYAIYSSNWSAQVYAKTKLEESVIDLQEYIESNAISSADLSDLSSWANKHPYMFFYLEKNGKSFFFSMITYDNNYEESDMTEEEFDELYSFNPYAKIYTIRLADGDCTMHVFEDFQYALLIRIQGINLVISALIVIAIITFLVRRKIHYINDITSGINILEGGELAYNIPVKGYDELSHVAESLNSMRIALSQQMENEKKALQANNSLVTALSHDLRTPLTTQMGYLEILKEHNYKSDEEMNKYLDTALSTCQQIKEMSDRLFEYFLAFDPNPMRSPDALEEYYGMDFFIQIISELTPPLMELGFRFNVNEPTESFKIKVNTEDILRVFNNIFTNIDKYADESEPVNIDIKLEDDYAFISFTNKIRQTPRINESAKIGLISIASLMKRQGGSSITRTSVESFTIELKFPAVRQQY